MNLPSALTGRRDHLHKAFMTAVPAEWPGEPYIDASQPEAIAGALIRPLHEHLLNAKIAYLFREDMKRGDRVKLGTASKASSKITHLTDYDFVLEFNWTAWRELTAEQRIALVDHELCHCALDDKDKYAMRQHDVEEFGEIVRRWGLWKPDLTTFGKDMADAIGQGELFHQHILEAAERTLAEERAGPAVQLTP